MSILYFNYLVVITKTKPIQQYLNIMVGYTLYTSVYIVFCLSLYKTTSNDMKMVLTANVPSASVRIVNKKEL